MKTFIKKQLSLLTVSTLLLSLVSFSAIAAGSGYIDSITTTVNSISTTTFNPSAPETLDFGFNLIQNADISVSISNSSLDTVYSFIDNTPLTAGYKNYSWTGRLQNSSTSDVLPNGIYKINIASRVNGSMKQQEIIPIQILNSVPQVSLLSFNSDKIAFDPSDSGEDEDISFSYSLSDSVDVVNLILTNSHNDEVKNFSANNIKSGNFVWNGEYSSHIVPQGIYTAKLTAKKSGQSDIVSTKTFNVQYGNSNRPYISNFEVSPSTFDNDYEDAIFTFDNDEYSYITFEIKDLDYNLVKTFSDYRNDDFSSNTSHSISWDGTNTYGSKQSNKEYKGILTARNDYGCIEYEISVKIDDNGVSYTTSNSHINNISFSPSRTFEPTNDDELEIEFDVRKDLDRVRVYAQRGSEKIELFDENDMEKQDNFNEITWDGEDEDGDYVDGGTWRILIETELNGVEYVAAKSISIKYDKPVIDDMYLSKTEFDNDLNESTYLIFMLKDDAKVDIDIYLNNDKEDNLIEDWEVEADKWYAVEWDGDSYDYGDDIDLKLIAKNIVNDNIYDSEQISVKLDEDDVSSSRSNVTEDKIIPVIGKDSQSFEISYNLEDDADVLISIYRGKTSGGSKMIELLDVEDQDSGDHTIKWNGRDDDGDRLNDGFYTYKIVSDTGSTDTEYGHFAVGDIGEIDGESSSSNSGDNNNNNYNDKVAPGVVIDGNSNSSNKNYNYKYDSYYCADFTDIISNSSQCEAIKWAKENGVFGGYPDGSFQPNKAINRVELLKVILKTFDVSLLDAGTSTLGFIDVQSGSWYMKYIKTAQVFGIFNGDAVGRTARPSDYINRAETVKLIFEALSSKNGIISEVCSNPYLDVNTFDWYNKYACSAKTFGLINDSFFNPSAYSTRGEVAEMLYKMSQFGIL